MASAAVAQSDHKSPIKPVESAKPEWQWPDFSAPVPIAGLNSPRPLGANGQSAIRREPPGSCKCGTIDGLVVDSQRLPNGDFALAVQQRHNASNRKAGEIGFVIVAGGSGIMAEVAPK